MVGAWEWIRLSGLVGQVLTAVLLVVFSCILIGCYVLPSAYVPMLLGIGCLFWIAAAAIVVMYPRSREQIGGKKMKLGFGLLVLIPAYIALLFLRRHEAHVLLIALLVSIIWAADVGAYFVGRQFGTRKLAPDVSPGKSWAGLIGGMVVALAVGMMGASLGEPTDHLFSPIAWAV